MKSIAVLGSVSRLAGGLQNSVSCLHRAISLLPDMEVSIFSTEDAHSAADVSGWAPLPVTLCPIQGPRAFSYAPAMLAKLLEGDYDIAHSHGLWQYPSIAVRRWHAQTGRPYVISPHGMLDPWAVRNSHWKKILADAIYEGSHLRNASCIRALCESEDQAIRTYGLKNPICVIPNGIDLPIEKPELRDQRHEKKVLLFLGRIHPKKGLPNALRAWKQALHSTFHEWQFVVAGWDQGGHEADLKRLCREIDVSEASVSVDQFLSETPVSCLRHPASVLFVGPAFGAVKDALLRRASAFILPSFSEGLPMSVLEAWSYSLPVLMTDKCNLLEGFAANAAVRIGTDVVSIAEGLRLLFESPISDLRSLGHNGRLLVSERFSWPMIAAQAKQVYEWILGGGVAPDCVRK